MTEQEAAERLAALLNEIEGAGHAVDLWDFTVVLGCTKADGSDGTQVVYNGAGFGVEVR